MLTGAEVRGWRYSGCSRWPLWAVNIFTIRTGSLLFWRDGSAGDGRDVGVGADALSAALRRGSPLRSGDDWLRKSASDPAGRSLIWIYLGVNRSRGARGADAGLAFIYLHISSLRNRAGTECANPKWQCAKGRVLRLGIKPFLGKTQIPKVSSFGGNRSEILHPENGFWRKKKEGRENRPLKIEGKLWEQPRRGNCVRRVLRGVALLRLPLQLPLGLSLTGSSSRTGDARGGISKQAAALQSQAAAFREGRRTALRGRGLPPALTIVRVKLQCCWKMCASDLQNFTCRMKQGNLTLHCKTHLQYLYYILFFFFSKCKMRLRNPFLANSTCAHKG